MKIFVRIIKCVDNNSYISREYLILILGRPRKLRDVLDLKVFDMNIYFKNMIHL